MPGLSTFISPGPYHILTYGTLLGAQIFHSFVGGLVAYKTLSRPQFSVLQTRIFPIYFTMQVAMPVVLALTYPGSRATLGTASSLSGVLDPSNRWSVLAPMLAMFVTGVTNMLYAGPKSTQIMKERKHQETRDGKKSYDPPPHSTEMQRLNREFGMMHGISSLLNMVTIIATISYGFTLAERIN